MELVTQSTEMPEVSYSDNADMMAPPKMNQQGSYSWSYSWEGKSDDENQVVHEIEQLSPGCCDNITFNYLSPLISRGNKQKLELHDIPSAPLLPDLEEKRQQFKKEYARLEEESKANEKMTSYHVLWQALKKVYNSHIYTGLFLFFLSKVAKLLQPQLLGKTVEYFDEDSDMDVTEAFLWGNGLIVLSVLSELCVRRGFLAMTNGSIEIKHVLTLTIFEKILKLSPELSTSEGTGKILNLAGTDIAALQGVFSEQAMSVFVIMDLPLLTLLIYLEVGPSAFSMWGVVLFMGCFAAAFMGVIQSRQLQLQEDSDNRLKAITEVIRGIKLFKLYAWEEPLLERVVELRRIHINSCKRVFNAMMGLILLMYTGSNLISVAIFGIYVGTGNSFNLRTVMVTMMYIQALGHSLMGLGSFFSLLSTFSVSMGRVSKFLSQKELAVYTTEESDRKDVVFEFRNATLGWNDPDKKESEEDAEDGEKPGKEETAKGEKKENEEEKKKPVAVDFKVKNLNFQVKRGQLTAIIGSVASGKTSLLNSVTGEMFLLEGEVLRGSMSKLDYVAQEHYIMNATVRENVLMDLEYDEKRYVSALRNASLIHDINVWDDADSTEIGARGINLSGGQKSRIALARSLYRQADVYLLDDVLSAVDPDVGDQIFNNAIMKKMSDCTRVIVLNSHLHNLKLCDHIIVMEEGCIADQGTYEELVDKYPGLMKSDSQAGNRKKKSEKKEKMKIKKAVAQHVLVEKESRQDGEVKWNVFKTYFAYMYDDKCNGWFVFAFMWTLNIIAAIFWQLPLQFLAVWGAQEQGANDVFGLNDRSDTWMICAFAVCNLLSMFGRILNKFTADVADSDGKVVMSVQGFLWMSAIMFMLFVVQIIGMPFIFPIVLFVLWLFYSVAGYFRNASMHVRRLQSSTQSPISAHFEEVVQNFGLIRICGYSTLENNKQQKFLMQNLRVEWAYKVMQQWFQIRLQCLGLLLMLFMNNMCIYSRDSQLFGNAAFLAIGILYAAQSAEYLGHALARQMEMENAMISVERLLESRDSSPKEKDARSPLDPDPHQWPSKGEIVFDDVKFKYREELPLVLKGVTFTVSSGEKIGVCGRTASGKSTLTVALFRLYEQLQGKILIDGVDINDLGLKTLRSAISIIPQDPVILAASLRYNLDPMKQCSDQYLLDLLEEMEYPKHWHLKLEELLDSEITEGGDNLSQGQKQLVCIARALLQDRKIVILDEATSNIDAETDAKIQAVFRKHFKDKTVLTIAHRIDTIVDSDKVLLLGGGEILEYANPRQLLDDPNSEFSKFVKGHGKKENEAAEDDLVTVPTVEVDSTDI